MGQDYRGQVLGGSALRGDEIPGNLHAVPRLVADGLHGSEVVAWQFRSGVVELVEPLFRAVVEVDRAGIGVAPEHDDLRRFVLGPGLIADLAVGKFIAQPFELTLEGLGTWIDSIPVAGIDGRDQFLRDV